MGTLPVTDRFALIGKLGIASYKLKFHCSGSAVLCPNPDRLDNDTATNYGVGAKWHFSPDWFVRGEYEVFRKDGESFNFSGSAGTSRSDVKMGSMGIGYRF